MSYGRRYVIVGAGAIDAPLNGALAWAARDAARHQIAPDYLSAGQLAALLGIP